ncbi:type II toxin-antitoxin system Phd/YefM family antitoxin [Derxia lacustris]|uniref:type II toxin-antitoxin system Phd/YefM family antitoxin n=1 Tax=Derxia lacustris TaxID=764842 RepID=UPI000A170A38|nr:type II toxin-antitoxin system Phd/YefM family antitoxin [Derxia lacustris]
MEITQVGIREFRAGLAEYIAAGAPVAVTRHGQTVGYFIPVQGPTEAELAALKAIGERIDRQIAERAVDVDAAVEEFKQLRKAARGGGAA